MSVISIWSSPYWPSSICYATSDHRSWSQSSRCSPSSQTWGSWACRTLHTATSCPAARACLPSAPAPPQPGSARRGKPTLLWRPPLVASWSFVFPLMTHQVMRASGKTPSCVCFKSMGKQGDPYMLVTGMVATVELKQSSVMQRLAGWMPTAIRSVLLFF